MIYPAHQHFLLYCTSHYAYHLFALYQLSMYIYRLVVLATLLCICLAQQNKVETICLNNDWELQILSDPRGNTEILNKRLHTMIPSNLHLDLIKHSIIEDPFLKNNYQDLKWVSNCSVKYTKRWKTQDWQKLRGRAIQLVFHGIDTYANVSLNGQHILQASNAFRSFRIRVEKYLRATEENVLEVIIQPVSSREAKLQQTHSMLESYAHTRKPAFQYSEHESPGLLTMGVWKSVELLVYDEAKIDYVWARNKLITENLAQINFAVKLNFNLFKQQKLTKGYSIQIKQGDAIVGQKAVVGKEVYIDVKISEPNFWWPNGMGQPYIYDFTVFLFFNKEIIHNKTIAYGIRTAELNIQNKQFELKINGYPIYCKGANYLPMDVFHPRLTNKYFSEKNSYSYEQLLQDVVDSNFNMIRIWGGGAYESEQFLQLASRKGIMIFFDFMFSNTNYPATPQFLSNVEQEIKQQIRKARNYPSVVVWNGNNQVKQKMDEHKLKDPAHGKEYDMLFNKLFKAIIELQDPFITYIPTSPLNGKNTEYFETGGDAHYWGDYQGVQKIQNYGNVVSPFTSAFGVYSLPVVHTINQIRQNNQTLQSKLIQSHQKIFSKYIAQKKDVEQYFPKPKNMEAEVYFSGLLQAYAAEMAIIQQRASKPKSYGTLFWHLNDMFPAASASSIDYYGRWKPLQYVAKRLFANLGIFTLANYSIVVVNDNLFDVQVYVKIWVGNFEGSPLFKDEKTLKIAANSVLEVTKIGEQLFKNKQGQIVSVAQIYNEKILQMKTTKYFTKPNLLKLPKQKLSVSYDNKNNQLTIESKKLVKNLFIYHRTQYLHLSDNYFDVVPGFQSKVKILRETSWKELQDQIKFMSMRDAGINEGGTLQELEVVFA